MEEKKIQGLYSTFKLTGVPVINKDPKKYLNEGVSDNGFKYRGIKFGVKTSDKNVIYIECSGGFFEKGSSVLKLKNTENEDIEIAWEDRLNLEKIADVADFKKTKAEIIEGEKKEFLSEYDFVEYIHKNLNTNMRIVAEGNIQVEKYKGKDGKYTTTTKYILKRIRLAYDNEKDGAVGVVHFIFDKETWDESSLNEDKKIYVNAFITLYDKELKETIFSPYTYVINAENRESNPEVFDKWLEYFKKTLTAKEGEYFETKWEVSLARGVEETEISLDELSESQKMQIELGLADLEKIKRDMRGGKIGNRVNEIRLTRPQTIFEGEAVSLTPYAEEDFIIREHKEEDINKVIGGNEEKTEAAAQEGNNTGDAVLGLFS